MSVDDERRYFIEHSGATNIPSGDQPGEAYIVPAANRIIVDGLLEILHKEGWAGGIGEPAAPSASFVVRLLPPKNT